MDAHSPRTLPQQLRHHAHTTPHRVALRQKEFGIWRPTTWQRYFQRASHIGLGLRALGLAPNTHIGILSENRIEWVLAQAGAGLAGLITVGVYPTSPSNEVAYVLAHAGCTVVFCEDQEQADKLLDAQAELPGLQKIVVMEAKGLADLRAEAPGLILSFGELEALGAGQDPALVDAVLAQQRLTDTALLIYTSGSTGKPKGAMLSYGNIAATAPGVIDHYGLSPEASHLSYLPLCHVAEQMLTNAVPMVLGSRVDFGESIRTVQEDLREVAPSMFLGVPRIWEKLHATIEIKMQETSPLRQRLYRWAVQGGLPLAERPPAQRSLVQRLWFGLAYLLMFRALQNFIGLRRCTLALTGAAPISPELIRYFRAIGVPLVEVYGMTETSGMVLGQKLDGVRLGTVGVPSRGAVVRIGELGELQVRGPVVFQGYHNNPEASASALVDGWLHTGDVVEAREGGHFKIVDRLKDIMITAGGKNISPSLIENTMKTSPFIKECIVIADRRKYAAALIQIEFDTTALWAEQRGIVFTTFKSLTEAPQVRELIEQQVAQGNASLAPVELIRRFHLLGKELDHDDGEVTATMKVRRSSIHKTYAADIEALYRGA